MVLTIFQDHNPSFRPLSTQTIAKVDFIPLTAAQQHHLDRLHPPYQRPDITQRQETISHVTAGRLAAGITAWVDTVRSPSPQPATRGVKRKAVDDIADFYNCVIPDSPLLVEELDPDVPRWTWAEKEKWNAIPDPPASEEAFQSACGSLSSTSSGQVQKSGFDPLRNTEVWDGDDCEAEQALSQGSLLHDGEYIEQSSIPPLPVSLFPEAENLLTSENLIQLGADYTNSSLSLKSVQKAPSLTPTPDLPVSSPIHFDNLPASIRSQIWTYVALNEEPRTVSMAAIKWVEDKPVDNNRPVALHEINQETRFAKTTMTSRHGYIAFTYQVVSCSAPAKRDVVTILVNPNIDMLHFTDDYLSQHGALLLSPGSEMLQSLHKSTLLSSITQLTLCCYDVSFPFMISQLEHFTSLRLLFVVTGTHYVKLPAKIGSKPAPEKGFIRRNRFDEEQADRLIWYAPHGHSYTAEDFLALIIRPFLTARSTKLIPLPGGKAYFRVPCVYELPVLKIVTRVNWFSDASSTLPRVRAQMNAQGMGGKGHRVMSYARYEDIWMGKVEVDYGRRQVRGKDAVLVGGVAVARRDDWGGEVFSYC